MHAAFKLALFAGASVSAVVTLRVPQAGRVRVPGATFMMGSTPEEMVVATHLCRREVPPKRCEDIAADLRLEGWAHNVTLSTYEIDRTEVTVGAYARCVDAGYCAPSGLAIADARFGRPDLPVVMVKKSDADDYCHFVNGRLPTEAEWEYAARGPTRRRFPWGNLYNAHLCNHGTIGATSEDATDGYEGLAPVGSFPDGAGPFGTLDQAGNAEEWVADTFDGITPDGFGYEPADVKNPKNTTGDRSIVRGGSWDHGALWQRSTMRHISITLRSATVGFRCAYDVR